MQRDLGCFLLFILIETSQFIHFIFMFEFELTVIIHAQNTTVSKIPPPADYPQTDERVEGICLWVVKTK